MISDIYSLVDVVVASVLCISGLVVLINKEVIKTFYDELTKKGNELWIYVISFSFLIAGLIVVWTHNDWYLKSPTIITTLFGWIVVIKTSFWLAFPKAIPFLLPKFKFLIFNPWFRIAYALALITLGLVLFSYYFFSDLQVLFTNPVEME